MKHSHAEIEALIAVSPRICVPLNKLALSADHQARTPGSAPKLSLPELAASIRENGVLQNLVVVEGTRGRYEVCAGGRRLQALTQLAAHGDIAANCPVPVMVVPLDRALIASLAENCLHVALCPADEYAAFAKLIARGKSVEDVAAAFGVTPLVVKRRLKLAAVSPALMTKFREGEIGLDCLMVLASVDDHGKQEQAWAALPQWNRRPETLRQLLTQGEIEAHRDPVAKFVSLKAYEKAGGLVRRDLFSDDEKTAYLQNAVLLRPTSSPEPRSASRAFAVSRSPAVRAAVQAELLRQPHVAVAALTAQLAQKVFHDNLRGYRHFDPVFGISVTSSQGELCDAAEDLKASRAWAAMEQAREAWQAALPEDVEGCFAWLLSQPVDVVLELLAFVVATTTKGVYSKEPKQQCNEAVAQALSLDMSAWWSVSGDSYLHHVSKDRVAEVVRVAVGASVADSLALLKKAEAVAGAEKVLASKGLAARYPAHRHCAARGRTRSRCGFPIGLTRSSLRHCRFDCVYEDWIHCNYVRAIHLAPQAAQ